MFQTQISKSTVPTSLLRGDCELFTAQFVTEQLKCNFMPVPELQAQRLGHSYLLTALKYWSLPPSQSHAQIAEPYPDLASQTGIPGA